MPSALITTSSALMQPAEPFDVENRTGPAGNFDQTVDRQVKVVGEQVDAARESEPVDRIVAAKVDRVGRVEDRSVIGVGFIVRIPIGRGSSVDPIDVAADPGAIEGEQGFEH